jgi:hypothetical protein
MPRRREPARTTGRTAPSPWLVLVTTLAAGGLLMGARGDRINPWIGTSMLIAAIVLAVLALGIWSRFAEWGAWHRFAAAAGGLLTYAWHGFTMEPFAGGGRVLTPVSHVVFALAAVALLYFCARSIRRRSTPVEPEPADVSAPVASS